MESKTNFWIKASGFSLTLLGLIHLLAHFAGSNTDEVPEIIQMMEAFKIELLGTHSLLSFHLGFSIMTGLFMIAFGSIQLFHASKIDRKMMSTMVFFTSIAFVVALYYFHPLAYGFILLGLIFQIIALAKGNAKS